MLLPGYWRRKENKLGRLWRKGEFARAHEIADRLATMHPEEESAWVLLVRFSETPEEKEDAAREGLQAMGDAPYLKYQLAGIMLKRKDDEALQESETLADELVAEYPELPYGYAKRLELSLWNADRDALSAQIPSLESRLNGDLSVRMTLAKALSAFPERRAEAIDVLERLTLDFPDMEGPHVWLSLLLEPTDPDRARVEEYRAWNVSTFDIDTFEEWIDDLRGWLKSWQVPSPTGSTPEVPA